MWFTHMGGIKDLFHFGLDMVEGERFNNNLYFDQDAERLKTKQATIAGNTFGQDKDSRFEDPMFSDLDGGDLSFKEGSPAFDLGIKSLPADFFEKVGPSYDPFANRYKEVLERAKKSKGGKGSGGGGGKKGKSKNKKK